MYLVKERLLPSFTESCLIATAVRLYFLFWQPSVVSCPIRLQLICNQPLRANHGLCQLTYSKVSSACITQSFTGCIWDVHIVLLICEKNIHIKRAVMNAGCFPKGVFCVFLVFLGGDHAAISVQSHKEPFPKGFTFPLLGFFNFIIHRQRQKGSDILQVQKSAD